MYKDKAQLNLIDEVHAMTYAEALAITGNESSTIGIRKTGACYRLASTYNRNFLWYVSIDGRMYYHNYCFGIHPVISLKSGVYIKSGDGTEELPYVLGIE